MLGFFSHLDVIETSYLCLTLEGLQVFVSKRNDSLWFKIYGNSESKLYQQMYCSIFSSLKKSKEMWLKIKIEIT